MQKMCYIVLNQCQCIEGKGEVTVIFIGITGLIMQTKPSHGMLSKTDSPNQNKQTLFAHIRPHALHKVLGPAGPRRIAGVLFSLTPQC